MRVCGGMSVQKCEGKTERRGGGGGEREGEKKKERLWNPLENLPSRSLPSLPTPFVHVKNYLSSPARSS